MNLEAKQKYYEYGGNYHYRQPPRLDNSVHRALKEIDPDYRLIFGGVAVVRKSPEDEHPYIRGDERATKVSLGRVVPRYLAIKVAQPTLWCYRSKKGHVVKVNRSDEVPKGKTTWCEARYIEFGQLRWFLERKLTAEQLIAAEIYHEKDINLPRQGDWIWRLTVETPEGRYFEPDRAWMQILRDDANEVKTYSLADLRTMDNNAIAERKKIQRAQELHEVDDFLSRHVPGYTPPDPHHVLTR